MDEKQLEVQELMIQEIEKNTEEAPTSDLGENGILVDGKGEDEDANS